LTRGPAILFLACAAFARDSFTAADLWQWRTAAEPQISADGHWVVYVERWNDRAGNTAFSNLQLVSADGRQARRLTDGPWSDRCPRWSADGARIAWLSVRPGGTSIRILRLGSAAETEIPVQGPPPAALAWSPDSGWLAYAAWVPHPVTAAWAPPALLPVLITGAPAGSMEVFVVPAASSGPGAAPRQLTHDSFIRRGPPAWTPDGLWILNSAERAPGPGKPLEGAEIYGIRVADGEVRWLTQHPGPDESPVPSPDGSKIAWIAAETKPAAYAIRKLWVMNMDGTRARVLTGSLDRDVTDPQWSSDSRTVYFLADDRGATHVYAAHRDGVVRQVTDRAERLAGFSLADNGRAVTVRSSATEGGEVVSFAVDLPGGITALAAPNAKLLATRDIGLREEIHFSSDGKGVQAWLVRPPHPAQDKPAPLLVEAGATPHAMCGAEFPLRAQIFAARGFAVLCVNTRGTPGFGEDFGNLLRTRFPGDDFDDLMRGVDAALAKGGIDPQRIFLSGGLLAAWAIGHTDRFRAAVICRPIADWTSAVSLTRDGYRRAAAWMGALPWDDPDQYTKHSPLFFAQNFKTPALVIGGDAQARELFFALQARKVDAALAPLPDDGKPGTAVLELETKLAWLTR
jgi:dipeptidyl aminopeptidase/acylaminoacyl peptidase